MDYGQKIKAARKAKGLTQKQLGDKLGVTGVTIMRYEKNLRQPRIDQLSAIAKALDTNVYEMLGPDADWSDIDYTDSFSPNPLVEDLQPIRIKQFPLLGDIACGGPILAEEHIEAYIAADKDIDADFCLRAKGDSMIGARIYDGDIVFIRKQDMVENGQIAAVLIGDEATLKRVQYDPNTAEIQLFAENPMFHTLRYSGEELNNIRILGRAVAFQGEVR